MWYRRKPPENIYRYNLDEKNCKLPLTVEGMLYPRGLASSDSKNCIYVIDWHKHYSGRIWCVVMRDDDIQTILDYHLDMQPFGISVSPHRPAGTNMKILITCKNYCKTGKIVVYEQKEDKSLVRSAEDYPLKSAPNPRQSIQNKDGNCFVCFGWWRAESHGLAKISSLDKSASNAQVYQVRQESWHHEFSPYSLALDGNALLVLDHCKNRVLLFNQDLDFKECILTKKHRIKQPRQICIDGQNREMFIGQQDGKIRCFSLSELYTDEL